MTDPRVPFRPAPWQAGGGPPAILVAGERSGCGKSTTALALMAALRRRGLAVQAFKTGPDFIDPGWHSAITGRPSRNLDIWMSGATGHAGLPGSSGAMPGGGAGLPPASAVTAFPSLFWQFHSALAGADVAVVEGAMGLYDGLPGLPASCADVALALGLPVLLLVDCQGMAATAAAVARGLAAFRPGLAVLGAAATFAGSARHADLLRRAFADLPDIPLLGVLPRQDDLALPSRHLGLVQARENPAQARELGHRLADWLERHAEVDTLLDRARRMTPSPPAVPPVPPSDAPGEDRAPAGELCAEPLRPFPDPFSCPLTAPALSSVRPGSNEPTARVRLALARDEAFSFWYPEHDILLAAAGADIIPFSPLRDSGLPPDIDGLLLPGGYPELHARELAANRSMRDAVRAFARSHPVYGECGGFLYLMERLQTEGKDLPMTGCLPMSARMENGRAALGYREVTGQTGPWAGMTLRGHEFHYSRVVERPDNLPALWASHPPASAEKAMPEGAALGQVCGSYVHLSFLSHPLAALHFVRACAGRALSERSLS